jgi:hypothetical protein
LPGLDIGLGIPIPWLDAKGLFPGLGIPGVDDGSFGAFGASVIELGASFESLGFGSSATSGAGTSATDSSVFLVVLEAAFGFAAFLGSALGLASGKAARSFLATGGAIVEEPLLTYSPSSSNFANATLVSIPSSLATS